MAYLRIFTGDTLLEQCELRGDRTTLGRTSDNDIVLTGHGVSKHHATIRKVGDAFELTDNHSVNGVFVNGKRIRRHTLRYWDEIQIFSFVLKFMAVPRLKGEESGLPRDTAAAMPQEATMEVDISNLGDLAKLRRRVKVPSLSVLDEAGQMESRTLDKVNFMIGAARGCDIRMRGWLAPRVAACIQRRNDGCYLMPGRRGQVRVNGHRVHQQTMLHDDDEITVRGMLLRFLHRPMGKG
jgi:predicted component of type VI protein secretion system